MAGVPHEKEPLMGCRPSCWAYGAAGNLAKVFPTRKPLSQTKPTPQQTPEHPRYEARRSPVKSGLRLISQTEVLSSSSRKRKTLSKELQRQQISSCRCSIGSSVKNLSDQQREQQRQPEQLSVQQNRVRKNRSNSNQSNRLWKSCLKWTSIWRWRKCLRLDPH